MNLSDVKVDSKIVNTIAKSIGIPPKKVYDFLFTIKSGKSIDNTTLLQSLGVSRNVLNQTKKALSSILQPPSTHTAIMESVYPTINSMFPANYQTEDMLLKMLKNADFEKAKTLLSKYDHIRPTADRSYDQFNATIETTARRVSLLNFLSDIENKRLLFLGDDDFTSIGVSALSEAVETCVLDIDNRLLNSLETIALKEHFPLKTQVHDFRKKLPPFHLGKYDTVFTDPPYTSEGVKLFLSRAIQSLDPTNLVARIYLCYGNSDRAKERYLPIYDIIQKSGLMIRYVFDKFNRYYGAESIGSSSVLFVLEVTPKTTPLITGNYEKPIYTDN